MKIKQFRRAEKIVDQLPYVVFFAAFLLLILVAGYQMLRNAGSSLHQDILRFHVIANSDSKEDQELKLLVKDTLLGRMQELLAGTQNKEQCEEILKEKTPELIALAQQTVYGEGYRYEVSADLASCYFPVKQYAEVVLPAGEYEAFRVTIGSAEGRNWWCMIFPSLCFVDETYQVIPEDAKEEVREKLSEEEFRAVWNDRDTKVKVKFWLWDKLEKLFSGS